MLILAILLGHYLSRKSSFCYRCGIHTPQPPFVTCCHFKVAASWKMTLDVVFFPTDFPFCVVVKVSTHNLALGEISKYFT